MKSGFKVIWTQKASTDFQSIVLYLEKEWTTKEVKIFVSLLDNTIESISLNPLIFQAAKKEKTIRKCILTKHNSLYYSVNKDIITILTIFDNRQNPKALKL